MRSVTKTAPETNAPSVLPQQAYQIGSNKICFSSTISREERWVRDQQAFCFLFSHARYTKRTRLIFLNSSEGPTASDKECCKQKQANCLSSLRNQGEASLQSVRLNLDKTGWHRQTEVGWGQWRSGFVFDRHLA